MRGARGSRSLGPATHAIAALAGLSQTLEVPPLCGLYLQALVKGRYKVRPDAQVIS